MENKVSSLNIDLTQPIIQILSQIFTDENDIRNVFLYGMNIEPQIRELILRHQNSSISQLKTAIRNAYNRKMSNIFEPL